MKIYERLNRFLGEHVVLYFGLVSVISVIVFIGIYPVSILDPDYTDWLLHDSYDLGQQYLGWKAYRKEAWNFPIGNFQSLSYPYHASIIYSDSIPVCSFLFKILSPVLPQEFQFHGIVGCISFVLQGIISANIVRKFTKDFLWSLTASVLFVTAPILIFRSLAQTSLGFHWIVLYALDFLLHYRKMENKAIYARIVILGILAASTSMYFIPMIGFILTAFCFHRVLSDKRFWENLLCLLLYFFSAAVTLWIFGGFSDLFSKSTEQLGGPSFNLNALINPQGWSCIFPTLPCFPDQYEGFSYLGAGIMLMIIAVFGFYGYRSICNFWSVRHPLDSVTDRANPKWGGEKRFDQFDTITFIVLSLSTLIFSLSPVVTAGERVLFDYSGQSLIFRIWSIFRSTGRFTWPFVYLVMIISIVLLFDFMKETSVGKRGMQSILLLFLVFLQIYDMHEKIPQIRSSFENKEMISDQKGDFWTRLAENDEIKHLVFGDFASTQELYSVTDWALDHGKTMNYFYYGRSMYPAMEKNFISCAKNPTRDCIFIWPNPDINLEAYGLDQYNLKYRYVGDWLVGYVDELP